jgi:hypothetical protein
MYFVHIHDSGCLLIDIRVCTLHASVDRGHKKSMIECAVFHDSSVRSSSTGLDGAIVLGVTSPAAISNKHFDNLAPADKRTRIRLINVVTTCTAVHTFCLLFFTDKTMQTKVARG